MSDQPLYRWLEQQGEAFGAPGLEPRWTSSVKDAVVTAYAASSRIWFTCSHGILNEIYYPTIDRPQVRDMGFLVTDGETFVHEEKRDLTTTFEYIDPDGAGGALCEPRSRRALQPDQGDHLRPAPRRGAAARAAGGREDLMPRLKVYALLAPHLDRRRGGQFGAGAGSCRAQGAAGVEERVVAGDDGQLRILAHELRVCGRERRLAGPDAELQDGLGVRFGDGRQHGDDGRDRSGMRCAKKQ